MGGVQSLHQERVGCIRPSQERIFFFFSVSLSLSLSQSLSLSLSASVCLSLPLSVSVSLSLSLTSQPHLPSAAVSVVIPSTFTPLAVINAMGPVSRSQSSVSQHNNEMFMCCVRSTRLAILLASLVRCVYAELPLEKDWRGLRTQEGGWEGVEVGGGYTVASRLILHSDRQRRHSCLGCFVEGMEQRTCTIVN